jgi:hypothetical protein
MLRRVDWQLVTDTLAQPIGSILKDQSVQEEQKEFFLDVLTLEDGTDRLYRNVGN